MRDYEELVRCLRDCNDASETDICDCDKCLFKDRIVEHDGWTDYSECETAMCLAAADAIEELQSYADLYKELTEKGQTVARKLIDAYPQWISVEDALPKNELETYWVYTSVGSQHSCRWTNNRFGLGVSDKWGWSVFDIPQYTVVTHWMPLPEPPKEDEDGKD